ncbi:hypothetical protein WI372_15370 [Gemmatimonadota bacterium DH-20]|uniref:DUF2752 domain-containing protein n=1 Tax=Gaopeijia maritima TaxID=3119007 RepID=A0ABU9EE15_9BACT
MPASRPPRTALPVVKGRAVARPEVTVAQRVGVIAGLAVVAGLFVVPHPTATLFWWGIVPLLPAIFLLHPLVWRNVCPLATLSMGGERTPRGSRAVSAWAGAAGVLPFVLLVAWRGTGLDTRPAETGGLLLAMGLVGAVTGRRGHRRGGFCNRLCPLLPIERLYGQSPLLAVPASRCPACTLCTPRGCLDLSASAAVPQLLGPARRGRGWLRTPFGAFSAALPGFIAAWFLGSGAGSGPPSMPHFTLGLSLGAAISWMVVAVVVRASGARWSTAMPTVAAGAVGLYYLLALPRAGSAWGWPEPLTVALQGAALTLVAAWWVRALRTRPGSTPVP